MFKIPAAQLAFHTPSGGVRWRITEGGIEIEGEGIPRTLGEPRTTQRAWGEYHEAINRSAVQFGVPVELIVATLCTESGAQPQSFREEPGYTSDAATPHRVSYGLMHTLLSTAKAMAQANGVTDAVTKSWLFTPANSIQVGTAYIASQKPATSLDPVLAAAAYNSGGVYTVTTNRWRLRQYFSASTLPHCDRFVQFFNDFWAVLNAHPERPALSIWEYFHQTPYVFPIAIDAPSANGVPAGAAVTIENVERYHSHLEKKHEGGYFPIGANTVWHGGVHLRSARGAPVVACADGEIIAARLGVGAKGSGHYGSTNFILVRHEIAGRVLNEAAAKCVGKKFIGFLMRSARGLNLRSTPTKSSVSEGLLVAGDALDIVTPTPTGADGYAWMNVKVKKAADPGLAGKEGWVAFLDDAMERVYEEPERIFEPLELKAFFSLYMHVNDEPLDARNTRLRDVAWIQKDGMPSQVMLDRFRSGEIVKLNERVHAREPIWTVGDYGSFGSATSLVHWEVFSEENLLPKLDTAEDRDADYHLDATQIFSMIGQTWLGSDENLDANEIAHFYKSNPAAQRLRRFACKFMSEWAVDPEEGIKNLKGRFSTWGLKERLRPYAWWRDASAKGVSLPGSTHVWHYNPVTFLSEVGLLTQKVPPIVMPKVSPPTSAPPAVSADSAFTLPVVATDADVWATWEEKRVPHFCQAAAPWADRKLGELADSATIARSGCAVSSVAMCLAFFGHAADPKTVDEYLDEHAGYLGDSLYWDKAFASGSTPGKKTLSPGPRTKDRTKFKAMLDSRLAAGLPTIAWVHYVSDKNHLADHFVVIVGRLKNGEYVMNDPGASDGDGASDPSAKNLVNQTARKQGYEVVELFPFTMTASPAIVS